MKLFVARWPDGTAWLVQATSMEEVAELLDEVGDPGACEVRRYKGPLVLEFQPSEDGWLDFCGSGGETGYDMEMALLRVAYPALYKVPRHDDGPSPEEWMAAAEVERKRELHASSQWAESVRGWWEDRCGGDADKTAALRDMAGVTIPGEPKPETPEQKRLFAEAQRRIGKGIAEAVFGPSSSRPSDPQKKQ